MVFQYTGALPSSNIVHEGRVNLKGRNSQIHHNHDSTSKNIRQLFFFFPTYAPALFFWLARLRGGGVCDKNRQKSKKTGCYVVKKKDFLHQQLSWQNFSTEMKNDQEKEFILFGFLNRTSCNSCCSSDFPTNLDNSLLHWEKPWQ